MLLHYYLSRVSVRTSCQLHGWQEGASLLLQAGVKDKTVYNPCSCNGQWQLRGECVCVCALFCFPKLGRNIQSFLSSFLVLMMEKLGFFWKFFSFCPLFFPGHRTLKCEARNKDRQKNKQNLQAITTGFFLVSRSRYNLSSSLFLLLGSFVACFINFL